MNTTIDFSTAKLLKEKGFDNESAHYYNEKGEMLFDVDYPSLHPTKPNVYYDNPTIAEVVMWLYEKHGIWVWVEKQYNPIYFRPVVDCISPNSKTHRLALYLHTPTEAYTAAIEYTLKHLI
jgi:hypothetical protein